MNSKALAEVAGQAHSYLPQEHSPLCYFFQHVGQHLGHSHPQLHRGYSPPFVPHSSTLSPPSDTGITTALLHVSNVPQLPQESHGLTFFFTLCFEMLKHHPSAREDMTADTPETSQKRRARKISTELLAAKLAEGNDAPWEGTRCDLEDSRQGWAAGQE